LSRFYEKIGVDSAGLPAWVEDSRELLGSLIGDVSSRILEIGEKGGSVLFEGSQGTLLDILYGSYPYVTSTHTTASYIAASLGIPPSAAGKSLGVTKCYTTRVGGGPFPTEEKGPMADEIRSLGNEYGATTGRPRRVGWLDLVALRYAVNLNGVEDVAISKLDVLSHVKDFRACVAYSLDGSETTNFQECLGRLDEVKPVYDASLSLHGARFDGGLPEQGKRLVDYVEDRLRVKVTLVSHGEERSNTIEL
jgi:adenylosuccinate synthase